MSTKKQLKLVVALAFALGFAKTSQAAVSDALTVTITPNAFYAVDLDTGSVSLDLGTVNLAASTQTVSPSTITIQSTYATTDLRLQGSIASAGTAWSFDADTTSNESDSLQAWATFTDITRTTAPAQGGEHFAGTAPAASGSDVISTTNRYVGSSAGDSTTNLFENGSGFAVKDMDGLPTSPAAGSQAHLWLFFTLPNATTSNDAQNVNIILTAVAPN